MQWMSKYGLVVNSMLGGLSLVVMSLMTTTSGAANLPVNETLLTRESPNFIYIYQASLRDRVPELAQHCEDAWAVVTPVLNYQPEQKVYVLFADNMDLHNGFATSFPEPVMAVFAGDATTNSSIFEPGNYLRRTVFHEFVHVLNLDAQDGLDDVLSGIFGRVLTLGDPLSAAIALAAIPPGSVAPDWYVEGLATWAETEFVGPGRGRNSVAEMLVRAEVAADGITHRSRWVRDQAKWPHGRLIYHYGARVFEHAQAQAPEENVPGQLGEAVANSWLFFMDKRARAVTGKSFEQLVKAAIEAEHADKLQQIEQIQQRPVTPMRRLSAAALQAAAPVYTEDGQLFFAASAQADEAELYRYNRHQQQAESTGADTSGLSTTLAAHGNDVYFTKLNFVTKGVLFNHMYRYRVDGHSDSHVDSYVGGYAEYLTAAGRYRSPAISADGQTMAAVRVVAGVYELVQVPLDQLGNAAAETVLWRANTADIKLIDPLFMPNGDVLVVKITATTGRSGLVGSRRARSEVYRVNAAGKRQQLLRREGLILSPTLHPNGDVLVFSSDESGVFNLYHAHLGRRVKPKALTNVLGGVFSPTFSADGERVAAIGYDADGYFLTEWRWDELSFTKAPTITREWVSAGVAIKATQTASVALTAEQDYWSVSEVGFDYWTPWLNAGADSAVGGVAANFSDPTAYQNLFMVAGAESEYGSPFGALVYTYDGWYPTVTAFARTGRVSYNDRVQTVQGFEFDYDEQESSVGLAVSTEVGTVDWGVVLAFGYQYTEREGIDESAEDYANFTVSNTGLFEGNEAALFLTAVYLDADQYPESFSLENGRLVNLGYEWTDDGLGGELDQRRLRLDWHEYLPVSALSSVLDNHVLKLQVSYAKGSGDVTGQGLFGVGGFNGLLGSFTPGVSRTVLLRGYETNAQVGEEAVSAGLAYRLPIWGIHRGADATTPIYFKQVFMEVFAEAGKAENPGEDADWLTSYGVEANLALRAFRFAEFSPGLGIVYAPEREDVDNSSEDDRLQLYISLKANVSF